MRWREVRRPALGACAVGVAALLAGCGGLTDQGENVVNGKQLFVAKCGACHTLARAGTKGLDGPNLDQAFARAREDGFKDSTFQGIVHRQILHPPNNPEVDPATGKTGTLMPANLVTGEDAEDVAAYVGSAVAKPGKDTGALARVGAATAKGTAKEKGGKLVIPADPGGSTSYVFANAEAKAGKVQFESPNDSSQQHDIAIEGNGVSGKGPVVSNGGVSRFSVTLKPGKYTFFCTVDAHRAAGMEGTLTVK